MTLDGGNFKFINTVIDISRINRDFYFVIEAKTECDLYNKSGIANNFLMDNCTLLGINLIGYSSIIYT
jgi:Na+-translocating ferredoxin:NAD+ oxidoreductase RnfA subunit